MMTTMQNLDHESYGHCAAWNQEQACDYCNDNPPAGWDNKPDPKDPILDEELSDT